MTPAFGVDKDDAVSYGSVGTAATDLGPGHYTYSFTVNIWCW